MVSESAKSNLPYFMEWTLYAIVTGLLVGFIGMLFRKDVDFGTANWNAHLQLLLLAPFSAMLIMELEKPLYEEKNGSTNIVIDSITESKHITIQAAPLIFLPTVLSHLVSTSVKREGAVLMIGGGLDETLSKAFRMDEKDRRVVIVYGVSAYFAATFGTPLTATIFPMEVISIGVMHYAALIPYLFAAFVATHVSVYFGVYGEAFPVTEVPAFNLHGAIMVVFFAVSCTILAMAFSILLYRGRRYTAGRFPNPWMHDVVGAVVLLCLTALNQQFFTHALDFGDGGSALIKKAYRGGAAWYSFLLEMIFTYACLFGSFKGGEIVLTLTISACFGAAFTNWFGLPVPLYTGIGVAAFFAGMTDSPFTSLFMIFEIFGFADMSYYAFAIAICFTLPGYYDLYTSQKFPYSKIQAMFTNRKGPRKLWNVPGGTTGMRG